MSTDSKPSAASAINDLRAGINGFAPHPNDRIMLAALHELEEQLAAQEQQLKAEAGWTANDLERERVLKARVQSLEEQLEAASEAQEQATRNHAHLVSVLEGQRDELREQLEALQTALVMAHTFAGSIGIWASHPAKPVDADWDVVAQEAARVKGELADLLTASIPAKSRTLRDEQFEHDYRMGTTPDE